MRRLNRHFGTVRCRAGLGLLVTTLVAFTPAAPASAAGKMYSVELCTAANSATSGLTYTEVNLGNIFVKKCGETAPGEIVLGSPNTGHETQGAIGAFKLTAPTGDVINSVGFSGIPTRTKAGNGGQFEFSLLEWTVKREGFLFGEKFRDDREFFPSNVGGTFEPGTQTFEAGLFCIDQLGCGIGGGIEVKIHGLSASLRDEVVAGFSAAVFPPAVAHGTVPLGITGEDLGSGISKIELLVDGKPTATDADQSDGCQMAQPFKSVQPCPLNFKASFSLDTTALAEGQHQSQYAITDAAGNERQTAPTPFVVHNAPIKITRPIISGGNKVGSKLEATTGEWENAPSAFAFQWFRCPASVRGEGTDVEACRAIIGATGSSYMTAPGDTGQRDLVLVTATNADGNEPALSLPTDVIETAPPPAVPGPPLQPIGDAPEHHGPKKPILTHLALSRKHFRIAKSASLKTGGSVLSFSSSASGKLSLLITSQGAHGKGGKRIGKLTAAIKKGRSRVLLSGEIGKKRLRPGKYTVTISVTAKNGGTSAPASLPFSILPG